MPKFHWRFFLLRWHRRLGVVSALFVLLLAITGVLLNHTHELNLAGKPLDSGWLSRHYGLPSSPAASDFVHPLPAGKLQARTGKLWLDDTVLGDCQRLVGVIEQAEQVLVACPDRLLLLTPGGGLIDQADTLRGVPEGLSAVTLQGEEVLLHRGDATFSVDLASLSVSAVTGSRAGATSPAPVPASAVLNWERVVLDLHSGRLFGRGGVWLMDAMALLFGVLAVSGLVMAARRRRHH